jgi:hypothetical protein
MGYTDVTLPKNARKPEAGPLGKFKGKAQSVSSVKKGSANASKNKGKK